MRIRRALVGLVAAGVVLIPATAAWADAPICAVKEGGTKVCVKL